MAQSKSNTHTPEVIEIPSAVNPKNKFNPDRIEQKHMLPELYAMEFRMCQKATTKKYGDLNWCEEHQCPYRFKCFTTEKQ